MDDDAGSPPDLTTSELVDGPDADSDGGRMAEVVNAVSSGQDPLLGDQSAAAALETNLISIYGK